MGMLRRVGVAAYGGPNGYKTLDHCILGVFLVFRVYFFDYTEKELCRYPWVRPSTRIAFYLSTKALGKKEPANKNSDLVQIGTASVRPNHFFIFFSFI